MIETKRIHKMLYGGSGVTGGGEIVLFVLPNELLDITAEGQVSILEASTDRTTPGCVHFATCGGCHYQQATYPAQLRIKEQILRDTFAAAGLTELPKTEIHAGPEWHYRNRIRLRIGKIDGELRMGYNRHNAAAGDPLLPIIMCPIAAPLLWRTAETLVNLAASNRAVRDWLTGAIELELFTNAAESALQLTIFTRQPPSASFPAFCLALEQSIPELTGAGVAILPKKPSPQGRRAERARPGSQWGAPGLIYPIQLGDAEDRHWVGRGAFFQVNRYLVAMLARLATSGRSGTLAWDLYAGVGLFSRALATHFDQVIAVEAGQPSATNLAAALASAPNSKNHRAFASTTLEFLQAALVQRDRPDLIVMDPPRAGVGPEVCALLNRIRCPELVSVSCDPVTHVRDLKQLTDGGYKINELHLVDMFPQTFHMESVAILRP